MSGRTKLIAGNWKMHFSVKQALSFASKLATKKVPEGVEVVVMPPAISLTGVASALADSPIRVGAQNAYYQDEGAFTGETSMPMLRGVAKYVLVGHSERRHVFRETDDQVRLKLAAAFRSGLTPILCVGETLVEKQHYHTTQVLSDQLMVGLADLTSEEVERLVIAYEPVWAISSGKDFAKHKAALPEDAQKAAATIRTNIGALYGSAAASKVRVLYGGSTSPENAKAFLAAEGVDGLLAGGASLGMQTFWPMVQAAGSFTPKQITVKKRA